MKLKKLFLLSINLALVALSSSASDVFRDMRTKKTKKSNDTPHNGNHKITAPPTQKEFEQYINEAQLYRELDSAKNTDNINSALHAIKKLVVSIKLLHANFVELYQKLNITPHELSTQFNTILQEFERISKAKDTKGETDALNSAITDLNEFFESVLGHAQQISPHLK